jgi:hypothetical protein
MIHKLGGSPALRAALPMSVDRLSSAAIQALVREASADLVEMLEGDDFADDIAAEALVSFTRVIRPEPVHPLAVVDAARKLSADTVVAWRPGRPTATWRTSTNVTIPQGDRALNLPLEAAAAVEALSTGEPVVVRDLPGLDADSALVVARRLVREAIIIVK